MHTFGLELGTQRIDKLRMFFRRSPLVPAAIGWMQGVLYVARANWERVEVRDEHGALCFAFEPARHGSGWMLSDPLFAQNHFVVAKSSGVMNEGFWAWEFGSWDKVLDVTFTSDGRPFLCQPAGTDLLLAQDPKGMAVWSLDSHRSHRLIEANGPDSAAVHSRTRQIAYVTSGALHVLSEMGLPTNRWSIHGTWESLAWGLDGSVLVGVPVQGGPCVVNPTSGETTHVFPKLGEILATSDDRRWIALEQGMIDLRSMRVHPHARVARAACFNPSTHQFALVDDAGIWKVPV